MNQVFSSITLVLGGSVSYLAFCILLFVCLINVTAFSIRHSENKNVMQITLSESEVKAAVQ